ncbi:immunoglobulin superfamily member 1-like isoform X2 [Lithobates pipiens]
MMTSIIVIQFGLIFFVPCSLATDIVQLDVLPNHQIYELGEDVSFTCCSADSMNSKVFEFYKEGSKIHSTEQSTNCTNFEIKIKTKQDAGSFQCLYQELENGTNIESNMSRSITINVAETPEAPSIRLTPSYSVYTKEESFTLTCSPPIGILAKGIQIYQEKKKIHEGDPLHSDYTISASSENAAGKYACKYCVEINGRNISSSESDYVTVIVTEIPEAPSIRLTPSYTVYTKEESFTLTCSPPIGISAKGIQIYQEKKKIHEGDPLHSDYTISASSENAAGKYTCKYCVEINGRNISSSESDYVTVIVTETPQAPSIRLTPSYTVYTKEESFTLTCSPPIGISVKGIQIYQEKKKIHQGDPLHSDYTISASSENAYGKYACKYWVEINGRNISSSESDYVTVSVTETPEAPSIRLTPSYTVYTKEESFTLTCSPPIGISAKGIEIYQEKKKIHEGDPLHSDYTISAPLENASGKYTCKYWVEINGRNISSSQSDYVTVSVTETPVAPSIRLTPSYTVYTKEESFTLTCSPPFGISVKGIQIYQEKKKIHEEDLLPSDYTISASSENASGKYTCKYLVEINGRNISSSESDYVTVIVTETPEAPSIRLTPSYTVYTKDESFTLTCSPPIGKSAKGIQIYQEKKKIHEEDPLPSDYKISASSENASGKYACKYWVEINGRNISSSQSDYVTVIVTETPVAPSIRLTPSYTVYTKEESFTLTCSPPIGISAKGIEIYQEKKKIHEGDPLHSDYTISAPLENASGKYTCKYWVEINGRNISSSQSDYVTVSVTETPVAPSIRLTPSYTVYTKEESFTLTCSPPIGISVKGIQIYQEKKKIHEEDPLPSDYTISASSENASGKYTCKYWVEINGRNISSSESDYVTVIVTDVPVAPVLMLVPNYQLYVTGETLQMLCMADSSAEYNFNIHKNDQLLMKSTVPKKVYPYSILSLNHGDGGNYTCTYHRNIRGRMLESFTSQPLNVHVIDPLPAPNLTLGHSVEKVKDGFQVTLNCSAPDSNLIKTFYFIKTSDKYSEKNVTDYSASLKWELGHISHVTVYCEYEEEIQERNIKSRRSQTLTIPLAGPSLLSPPAVAGIIGVVSLLLCLALVLLFYMKYKRKYKEKRFHFSLYWKTPKKTTKQDILNNAESKEGVNQDQENLREVSRKSKRLSITTAKDNSEDIAMNFFTFQTGQSKNLPDDDLSTFQSQPEQSEDLSTSALATFHCQPRPSEDLAAANCVWNYSYL